MIRFQYELGSGIYARLNAIKEKMLESGKFQLISEDENSASSGSVETSKKIVLKYDGIDENIVFTESSNYHYLKFQSGTVFIKTKNRITGGNLCYLFLYAHGFAILYGDRTIFGMYQIENQRIAFSFDPVSLTPSFLYGETEKNGEFYTIQASSFEGEKVAYFELPFSVKGDLKGHPFFMKLYQVIGANVSEVSTPGVVLFEQGGRFFRLPGASKIMLSLEGEGV